MTEREKLIELLKCPNKGEQLMQMGVDLHAYQGNCIEALIADFLLANGVTVLDNENVKDKLELTEQLLEAAIAGQETLQRYFISKDKPDSIKLRYNEATGEWDKYEPYMTIECPEEKDYEFLETALAKQTLKKPSKESLADYGCPVCGAYINSCEDWYRGC